MPSVEASGGRPLPIALQLYTVRDQTAQDFAGTLRKVAELGYGAVELFGYKDLPAPAMRALLDESHITPVSAHIELTELDGDLDAAGHYCASIGCHYVMVPSLPPGSRDAEGARALAPRMSEMGRRFNGRGISFGYHTHHFDFAPADPAHPGAGTVLDVLLDATDPRMVALELDVFWSTYAGVDPRAVLSQRAGRVQLLHLKDMAADRDFTEVGSGTLDIPAMIAAGRQAGVRWYVVENDTPHIPSLESARVSLDYLRGLPTETWEPRAG